MSREGGWLVIYRHPPTCVRATEILLGVSEEPQRIFSTFLQRTPSIKNVGPKMSLPQDDWSRVEDPYEVNHYYCRFSHNTRFVIRETSIIE